MMSSRIEMTGKKFGRLTVLTEHPVRRRGRVHWECRCDCGVVKRVAGTDLRRRNGPTLSCGCFRDEKAASNNTRHGHASRVNGWSPEYRVWMAIKTRTSNPNDRSIKYYQDRGISICARWKVFENFLADMGPRPKGCSIDRINNDLGYEPGNCRWATPKQQSKNRRCTKRGIYMGVERIVSDVADETGVPIQYLNARMAYGRSLETAVAMWKAKSPAAPSKNEGREVR